MDKKKLKYKNSNKALELKIIRKCWWNWYVDTCKLFSGWLMFEHDRIIRTYTEYIDFGKFESQLIFPRKWICQFGCD